MAPISLLSQAQRRNRQNHLVQS